MRELTSALKGISIFLLLFGFSLVTWQYFKPISFDQTSGPTPLEDCQGCNVVVIVIDTLRADFLPFYGYPYMTAPFMDQVAAKSIVFEKSFSTSSWTAPATASIFTSAFSSRHRVITGFAATKDLQKRNASIELNKLPKEQVTLGEYMKRAGYATMAVTDNINIGTDMGFDRGFDHFANYEYEGAPKVNKTAKKFLDSHGKSKPYFMYLHYMDPHSPYRTRDPWYSSCAKKRGDTKKARTKCAYESEILYTDTHIAELFSRYKWFENSIVIITSDHGEEFWDHGRTGHGKTLYTEMLHVPFLVYHPNRPPRRVQYHMQPLDILPTLARMMGQEKDPKWEGRSVRRMMKGETPSKTRRLIFSERLRHINKADPAKRSIIDGPWHYIETTDTTAGDKLIKAELYNIDIDYAERKDLSRRSKHMLDELTRNLAEFKKSGMLFSEGNDKVKVPVNNDMLKELRSLGYF